MGLAYKGCRLLNSDMLKYITVIKPFKHNDVV